ncbi:MAG: hypothetical protein DMG24_12330 [Acidobacteria bacterium]|nr:MAG: hypothetical protein DMG24_12330 [Acidobacteriota bacterium]
MRTESPLATILGLQCFFTLGAGRAQVLIEKVKYSDSASTAAADVLIAETAGRDMCAQKRMRLYFLTSIRKADDL